MAVTRKKVRVNRVRLGGGGPYVSQQTYNSIQQLCEKLEISQGKVVDRAVALLVEANS